MALEKRSHPSINRLFELQHFLHRFHFIERVVSIPGEKQRSETDTEHSFSLAMTAWFLSQYYEKLNTDKVIRYALVHDLVEIYAGDTFAFAKEDDLKSKHHREAASLIRIKNEWKDFSEMIEAIEAYENKSDSESRFVYALDKIMPPLIIFMGKGGTWRAQKITFDMHHGKKSAQVAASPEIEQYYKELVELMRENIHYFYNGEPS